MANYLVVLLGDTMGRKVPLIIGNLLCVISGLYMCLCTEYRHTFTRQISTRFNRICRRCNSAKAIARDFASGQELTKLFAMLMMVNGLAPVLAPLVGGQLLLITTWRFIFIIFSRILCIFYC
ncbi:MAG: MFS transporter [Veillonella sp.]